MIIVSITIITQRCVLDTSPASKKQVPDAATCALSQKQKSSFLSLLCVIYAGRPSSFA
jgi:hypothetical protein